jgi:hypothetical protein
VRRRESSARLRRRGKRLIVPTPEELADEARRIRRLRLVVDFTAGLIMQGALGRREAEALVGIARRTVLDLFPGSEQTYEIVYARRFQRLLDEFAGPEPAAGATVIRFPAPRQV